MSNRKKQCHIDFLWGLFLAQTLKTGTLTSSFSASSALIWHKLAQSRPVFTRVSRVCADKGVLGNDNLFHTNSM